jgi:hypothetical protein
MGEAWSSTCLAVDVFDAEYVLCALILWRFCL